MGNTSLYEYRWTTATSNYTHTGGAGTLELIPDPKSVTKNVSLDKRIRRKGRNRLQAYRAKYMLTQEYTLQGSCSEEKRREIEYYSVQHSKFRLTYVMDKTHENDTNDPTVESDTWEIAKEGFEAVYVAFDSVTFSVTEGKRDWMDYNIKLKRVDAIDISI
jgi:hypothetical protein